MGPAIVIWIRVKGKGYYFPPLSPYDLYRKENVECCFGVIYLIQYEWEKHTSMLSQNNTLVPLIIINVKSFTHCTVSGLSVHSSFMCAFTWLRWKLNLPEQILLPFVCVWLGRELFQDGTPGVPNLQEVTWHVSPKLIRARLSGIQFLSLILLVSTVPWYSQCTI